MIGETNNNNSAEEQCESRTNRVLSIDLSESGMNTARQQLMRQKSLGLLSCKSEFSTAEFLPPKDQDQFERKKKSSPSRDSDTITINEEDSFEKKIREDTKEFLSYSLNNQQKKLQKIKTKETFKAGVPKQLDEEFKKYKIYQTRYKKVAQLFLYVSSYNIISSIMVRNVNNVMGGLLGLFMWFCLYISTRKGELSVQKRNFGIIFSALRFLVIVYVILGLTLAIYIYILVINLQTLAGQEEISEVQEKQIIYYVIIPVSVGFISNIVIMSIVLHLRKKGNNLIEVIYSLVLKDTHERLQSKKENQNIVSEFNINNESDQDQSSQTSGIINEDEKNISNQIDDNDSDNQEKLQNNKDNYNNISKINLDLKCNLQNLEKLNQQLKKRKRKTGSPILSNDNSSENDSIIQQIEKSVPIKKQRRNKKFSIEDQSKGSN